jgi:hypothetical protein
MLSSLSRAGLLIGLCAAGTYGCGQRMPVYDPGPGPGPGDGGLPDASAADVPRDTNDAGAQDQSARDQSILDLPIQDQAAEDGPTTPGPDAGSPDTGAMCPTDASTLNVCGCGCCGGAPEGRACYYPARGESTSTIPNPMPSAASCAAVGCSFGTRYVCCADPGAPAAPTASYCSRDLATNLERYVVIKTEGALCTQFQLDGYTSPSAFPISTTAGFSVSIGSRGPCDGSAPRTSAIGGLGRVTFRRAPGASSLDAHVTLFFDGAAGPASGVRLDVDGLTLSPGCPSAALSP